MSEKNNNGLKVALGIVIALLLGVGALFFMKNNELAETKTALNAEIETITGDLESLKLEYDKQINENDILNQDLVAERDRLALTIDSLRASQADVSTLLRYKNQYFRLKKEKDRLFEENKRLIDKNMALTVERDTLNSKLQVATSVADSLSTQLTVKEKVIALGSQVTIAGLKGLGIIERSSGKQILTTKARRADKLKICYAVAENRIAKAGDKEYYVQVLDANSNVLGENATKEFEGKTLSYSYISSFNYNNKAVDICEYLSEPKGGFEKGTYFINVFDGENLISNSSFELE